MWTWDTDTHVLELTSQTSGYTLQSQSRAFSVNDPLIFCGGFLHNLWVGIWKKNSWWCLGRFMLTILLIWIFVKLRMLLPASWILHVTFKLFIIWYLLMSRHSQTLFLSPQIRRLHYYSPWHLDLNVICIQLRLWPGWIVLSSGLLIMMLLDI